MTTPRFGRVQLEIMKILWERGRATARQITDALAANGGIAHSTVQTLLRKLEVKGAVRHTVEERTFVFHPQVDEESVTRSATRDLIGRLFGGSASGLVAHLIRNEKLSREELIRIRKLIEEGRK